VAIPVQSHKEKRMFSTVTKRQKELKRAERRREKEAKKQERKKLRTELAQSAPEGVDPDIAHIRPGPQPPLDG
jgi:hypothetical protein